MRPLSFRPLLMLIRMANQMRVSHAGLYSRQSFHVNTPDGYTHRRVGVGVGVWCVWGGGWGVGCVWCLGGGALGWCGVVVDTQV